MRLIVVLAGAVLAGACATTDRTTRDESGTQAVESALRRGPALAWSLARARLSISLPATADRPAVIRREDRAEPWLSVSPRSASSVRGQSAPGRTSYPRITTSSDLVYLPSEMGFEDLRILHDDHTDRTEWDLRWSDGVASARVVSGDRLEVLGAEGEVLFWTDPAFVTDARGARRALLFHLEPVPGGATLTGTFERKDLVAPIVVDPAWSAAASAPAPLSTQPTATLAISATKMFTYLNDASSFGYVFDAAAGTWTKTGAFASNHSSGGSVVLASGKVLSASSYTFGTPSTGAEVLDPTTGVWSAVASTASSQRGISATALLTSGRALFIGGDGSMYLSTVEAYDPTANSWSLVAPLNTKRAAATATVLASGKVLVVGGSGGGEGSSEVYDPVANTWSTPTALPYSVGIDHRAVLLASGKVMVIGACPTCDEPQLYDPAAASWSLMPKPATPRRRVGATRLVDGRVLVVGGLDAGGAKLSTSEIYDPTTNAWWPAGSMAYTREFPKVVTLSGKAYVIGGTSSTTTMSTVEVFAQLTNGTACSLRGECASGNCVDGVCCDKACNGQCEACDVAGKAGTCSNLDKEGPHGSRAACAAPTKLCVAGACSSTCASESECPTGHFCKSGTCTATGANGSACSGDAGCASGHCVEGLCCNAACAGQCEACDMAGSVGTCVAVKGPPHGARPACKDGTFCSKRACDGVDRLSCAANSNPAGTPCSEATCVAGNAIAAGACDAMGGCSVPEPKPCSPYQCGSSACKTSCSTGDDCAAGFECVGGACRPAPMGKCSEDKASSISPGGAPRACAPYPCNPTSGDCFLRCGSSADCAPSAVCDVATGQCTALADDGAGGGCAHTQRAPRAAAWMAAILALGATFGRRRRSSR